MGNNIKFGTDGWRAIIAEDFTFDNVELVTKAVAAYIKETYLPSKPIIVSYDTRFLADKFAQRSADVLSALGFNVLITQSYAPTPVIAYSAKKLKTAGALMFTASHNPPEYCGIKYIPDYAGPATKEITDVIVNNVQKLQEGSDIIKKSEKKGSMTEFNPKEDYFEWVRKLIDFEKIRESGIKIHFDPLYATALGYFDELLKSENINIDTIHDWLDPLYGGGMPEPKPKFLQELIKKVKTDYPSVGFSNDGDADRFGVIDEKGRFITPNEVIAVLFKHLVKNKHRKGGIVKTVAASLMLNRLAAKFDIPIYETPVGFKWVGEIMRREDIVVGGEESGGLSIWGHIPEKDGIIANLCILEAMAYEGKPLFEIVEDLKKEIGVNFINHRIDLKLTEKAKQKAMNMFLNEPPKNIGSFEIQKTSKKDGVKFYFEDGNSWILVRPSGTEPLLRIYFETDSVEKMENLTNEVKTLISKL